METSLTGLDFSPETNLARYLQNIRQYPLLSQEEEYDLDHFYGAKNIPMNTTGTINDTKVPVR